MLTTEKTNNIKEHNMLRTDILTWLLLTVLSSSPADGKEPSLTPLLFAELPDNYQHHTHSISHLMAV